jgi:hypothetical protein
VSLSPVLLGGAFTAFILAVQRRSDSLPTVTKFSGKTNPSQKEHPDETHV